MVYQENTLKNIRSKVDSKHGKVFMKRELCQGNIYMCIQKADDANMGGEAVEGAREKPTPFTNKRRICFKENVLVKRI